MGRTEEYGAESRGQKFMYDPAKLILIVDPKHPLYQVTATKRPPQWQIDSIMTHGVVVPIKVRRGAMKRGVQTMEVIYGRRRVLSARIANEILVKRGDEPYLVPGEVFSGTDAEAVELMMLENHDRESPSMLDDAYAARNLLARGASEQSVLNRMRWSVADLKATWPCWSATSPCRTRWRPA